MPQGGGPGPRLALLGGRGLGLRRRPGDLDFAGGLEEAGFCVHSALDLDPSNGDISELAEQLGDVVDLVMAAGYGSVDLVAHSMGGLVSRYYTTYIDSSNVANIVMLGTPNHGTTAATFGDLAVVLLCQGVLQTAHLPGSLCGLAVDLIKGEAGRQMEAVYLPLPFLPDISRESPFLQDLNGAGLPEGVRHWTIAGTTALLGPLPGLLVLSGAFVLPNPDDGLVSAHSVCLNGSDAHYRYPINHIGLHEEATVLDRVSVILRGASPEGVECTPSVEALGTQATGDTPSVPQIVLSVAGTVSTGGEQVHGFPVEEGVVRASFIAAVSDPAVELSLQSPSGAIGPDSPAFSEEAEGLVKVYRLEAPASGDWSVVLGLPGGTGDPASYRVEVWADARLSLLLSTSRGLYLPGEAAELEAILQAGEQPVTGGEATAIITTPGGGTAAIPLVESGDGIYSLSYSPEDRWRYGVQVTASGEHEGVEYTRQSTTTFWVVGGVPLQGAVRLEGRSDHNGARVSMEPGDMSTLSGRGGRYAFPGCPRGLTP